MSDAALRSFGGPPAASLPLPVAALFVGLALALHLAVAATVLPQPGTTLIDPDSYMRLVRVQALLDGGGWFDGSIARANAPYGDTLHWTRPLDVLLVLLMAPLRLLLPQPAALHWAGVLVSPLLQICACFAAMWAARPLIGAAACWALPALLLQPPVFAYAAAGRADHHMLILLAFVLGLGAALRALADDANRRAALAAGGATGFGLWLSVEFVIPWAMFAGAFALAWACAAAPRARGRQWLLFSYALASVVALALVVERAPADWLAVEYDRISIVHAAASSLGLLAAIVLADLPLATRALRLALLAVAGSLALFELLLMFPQAAGGPMAGVDPRIMALFVDRVVEMRPLWPRSLASAGDVLQNLGVLLLALPALAVAARPARGGKTAVAWLALAGMTGLAALAALEHFRFAALAAALAAIPLAYLLERAVALARKRIAAPWGAGAAALAVVALLLAPVALARAPSLFADARAAPPEAIDCPEAPVLPTLAGDAPEVAGSRIVLANDIGMGPALLYRTRHDVVATPYHRNARGMLDALAVFAATDDAAAQKVLTRRGVSLLLICRAVGGALWPASVAGRPTLHARLLADDAPSWLRKLPLPATADGYRLFAVAPPRN